MNNTDDNTFKTLYKRDNDLITCDKDFVESLITDLQSQKQKKMRFSRTFTALAASIALVVVAGTAALIANDRGLFKNDNDKGYVKPETKLTSFGANDSADAEDGGASPSAFSPDVRVENGLEDRLEDKHADIIVGEKDENSDNDANLRDRDEAGKSPIEAEAYENSQRFSIKSTESTDIPWVGGGQVSGILDGVYRVITNIYEKVKEVF